MLRKKISNEKIIEEIKKIVFLKPADSGLKKEKNQENKVLMYALGG
jgi:hypothetical protein